MTKISQRTRDAAAEFILGRVQDFAAECSQHGYTFYKSSISRTTSFSFVVRFSNAANEKRSRQVKFKPVLESAGFVCNLMRAREVQAEVDKRIFQMGLFQPDREQRQHPVVQSKAKAARSTRG